MIQDLYERHFEELRRYCLQLCRSGDMAFDLVQETFLKALEREEDGFSRAETELLLLRLPAEDRTMFRLRYLEGYSAVEIGEMFDMPPATVRTRLLRSRQLLKKEMSL